MITLKLVNKGENIAFIPPFLFELPLGSKRAGEKSFLLESISNNKWRGALVLYSHSVISNYIQPHGCIGSSVLDISQAKIPEWTAISYSRKSSWPRNWTCISCIYFMVLVSMIPCSLCCKLDVKACSSRILHECVSLMEASGGTWMVSVFLCSCSHDDEFQNIPII